MGTTTQDTDDNSTATRYAVTLKPEYQYQHDRREIVKADSVGVESGLVVFRDANGDPIRMIDADDILEVRE